MISENQMVRERKILSNIRYIVDENGKKTSMVIDLKDAQTRAWAERVKEDLLDWERVQKWKEKANKETFDFFEEVDEILSK